MENIAFWLDRASLYDWQVGSAWYPAARQQCQELSTEFGFELKRVVWAVAALSPQLKWERNIRAARAVMGGRLHQAGAVYPANVEKAVHILHDQEDWERWLIGPKVTCFARNILGDTACVTVDTWAWRVWSGSELFAKPPSLDRIYDQVASDYNEVGRSLGKDGVTIQAVTWTTIRRVATGHASPGQLSLDI